MSCLFCIFKPQDATIQSLFYTLFFKAVQYFCTAGNSKKSRFIKKRKARLLQSLLSQLGIKTPLSKIPLLGDILNVMMH